MTSAQKLEPAGICPSEDCYASSSPCSDSELGNEFLWTAEDMLYTKLFQAWDNLPVLDASKETELLAELDQIIVPFDAYIGHNDVGFRAWVKRHQCAMELGLAETPTWPKLFTQNGGGRKKWKDEAWVTRYSFLVHQRNLIAKSRLQHMKCCQTEDRNRFFGSEWAYPRQTVRTVQCKSLARLRNRWYDPLDYCLARIAYESYGRLDFYTLRAEFWGLGERLVECEEPGGLDRKHVEHMKHIEDIECAGEGK